jgi:tetratricopeptide (TPR) repeat protein
MSEHERSLSDIEKVLALEPRHFGALAGRGMIHAHAGRWKEALDAYRDALAVNPFLKERSTIVPELERRAGEKPL